MIEETRAWLMSGIVVFKIIQFAVMGVFILFISDFRTKKNMVPIVGKVWTLLLRASYLVPIIVYLQVLFVAAWIGISDVIALGITTLGASLVVKAKLDLAEYHTSVGYRSGFHAFICNGIYAHMRHPLYAGIYLVIIGSLFTVIPHIQKFLFTPFPIAALAGVLYAMGFLGLLARKETKALKEIYGVPFQHYCAVVHPFLPLRKYHPLSENN
jgi:protein-S-isoprenylcysteine O-methyltransferase Ste14